MACPNQLSLVNWSCWSIKFVFKASFFNPLQTCIAYRGFLKRTTSITNIFQRHCRVKNKQMPVFPTLFLSWNKWGSLMYQYFRVQKLERRSRQNKFNIFVHTFPIRKTLTIVLVKHYDNCTYVLRDITRYMRTYHDLDSEFIKQQAFVKSTTKPQNYVGWFIARLLFLQQLRLFMFLLT